MSGAVPGFVPRMLVDPDIDRLTPEHQVGIPRSLTRTTHPPRISHNTPQQAVQRAGRAIGTLHELTKLAPVAIIAETLGYSPATVERHSVDSAAAYASCVAAVSEVRRGRLASTPRAGST